VTNDDSHDTTPPTVCVCVCVCVVTGSTTSLGWTCRPYGRQPDTQTDLLRTVVIRQTPTVRSTQALYKDTVKVNMKRCGLQPKSLSTAAFDRARWRTTCQSAIAAFEETRVAELVGKRAARRQQAVNITGTAWPCDRCNKICSSSIGLFTHRRNLPIGDAIRRHRRCTPCVCVCVW